MRGISPALVPLRASEISSRNVWHEPYMALHPLRGLFTTICEPGPKRVPDGSTPFLPRTHTHTHTERQSLSLDGVASRNTLANEEQGLEGRHCVLQYVAVCCSVLQYVLAEGEEGLEGGHGFALAHGRDL